MLDSILKISKLINQIESVNNPIFMKALELQNMLAPKVAEISASLEAVQNYNQIISSVAIAKNIFNQDIMSNWLHQQDIIVNSLNYNFDYARCFTAGLADSVVQQMSQISLAATNLSPVETFLHEMEKSLRFSFQQQENIFNTIATTLTSFSNEWINKNNFGFVDDFDEDDKLIEYDTTITAQDILASDEGQVVISTISNADAPIDKMDTVISMVSDLKVRLDEIEKLTKQAEEENNLFQVTKFKKNHKIIACLQAFLIALFVWLGWSVADTAYEELLEPQVKRLIVSMAKSTLEIADMAERKLVTSKFLFIEKPVAEIHISHKYRSPVIVKAVFGTKVEIIGKYKKWRQIQIYDNQINPVLIGWVQNWKLHKFRM